MKIINALDPYSDNRAKRFSDCAVAKRYVNLPKNRYPDALPTDKHRIRLQHHNSYDTDYINAYDIDYINASVFEKMILTQGPLETTVADFWVMLFEQKVDRIACLTAYREPHPRTKEIIEKTYPYWNPALAESKNQELAVGTVLFEKMMYKEGQQVPLKVVLSEKPSIVLALPNKNNEHVIKQIFTITLGVVPRQVCHYHYINWIDHEGADPTVLVAFAKLLLKQGVSAVEVHPASGSNETPNSTPSGTQKILTPQLLEQLPVLALHCSAGIGRSGTLAVLLYLIEQYTQTKKEPTEPKEPKEPTEGDVLKAVLNLRETRLGCVVNPTQLEVLFEAFVLFIPKQ